MSEYLVTGATRGLGLAIARDLVGRGHLVHGVYRSSDGAAAELVKGLGAGFVPHRADLGVPTQVDALVEGFGNALDGVVFNAGISVRAAFEALPDGEEDPLESQIRLDLIAPLSLCRALLRAQRVAADASLIFVSSNLARRGLPGKVVYGAAKAGLEGAVRGLARELGSRGIRVNAVAPGLVRTDMTRDLSEEAWTRYASEVPLQRAGSAEDVASVVGFLLSERAAYVTGQVIDVDGGWSC